MLGVSVPFMSNQIKVKIKIYARIIAYIMGSAFMLGPIALAVFIYIYSPGQIEWFLFLILPSLSLFCIYNMIDSISEVTVNQNSITWRYLFMPKVCTVQLNCLSNIKPYYNSYGCRSGFKYVFNNRKSFGIVDLDMTNSEALFEHLSQYLKITNGNAAQDASHPRL